MFLLVNVGSKAQNKSKTYLLEKIYYHKEYIRKLFDSCKDTSGALENSKKPCAFENKELFVNMLDSSFSTWKNYEKLILKSFLTICNKNILLHSNLNQSLVINDSIYVYLLGNYLFISDERFKIDAFEKLINKTSHIELQRNSKTIKSALRNWCVDNDFKQKEKKIKLLTLLKLNKSEKDSILQENLLTKKEKEEINGRIKKAEVLGKKVSFKEIANKLYGKSQHRKDLTQLPIEIKARLGDESALKEILKLYDKGPSKELVEKLIYIGADTCFKHLILRLNAPAYDTYYRHLGTQQGPSTRFYIIKGLRKHFPDDTLINGFFEDIIESCSVPPKKRYENMRFEEYRSNCINSKKEFVRKFKKWAFVKFKIKPKEPDLPIGIRQF